MAHVAKATKENLAAAKLLINNLLINNQNEKLYWNNTVKELLFEGHKLSPSYKLLPKDDFPEAFEGLMFGLYRNVRMLNLI